MKYANNAEVNIIRKVLDLETFEGALFRGVKSEHFVDKELGEAWDFILIHWSAYGKIPAHETVREFYPNIFKDILKVNPPETPDFYAVSILEAYARRGLAEAMISTVPLIEEDVQTAIISFRETLAKYDIIRAGVDLLDLNNTARDRHNDYHRLDVHGIEFGWPTLDGQTMGMHPGQLVGYVARGGQGKTWCLLYTAYQAWLAGHRVLVVATEIPPLDMLKRVDALHLHCNYNLYKKQMLPTHTVEQYEKFLFESNVDDNERFKIIDGSGLTPSAISVLVDHHKFDAVFIDGVYLIESDGKYRESWQKVRLLANELKQLARRQMIGVAYTTQFNTSVGTTLGKSKKVQGGVENMAYGDEFGKASDLIISIFRDEDDVPNRLLSMVVIKGREIRDGLDWKIWFDFEKLSFAEYSAAQESNTSDEGEPSEAQQFFTRNKERGW